MSKTIFRPSQLSTDGIAFGTIVAAGLLILTLGSVAPLPAAADTTVAAAASDTVVAQQCDATKSNVRG